MGSLEVVLLLLLVIIPSMAFGRDLLRVIVSRVLHLLVLVELVLGHAGNVAAKIATEVLRDLGSSAALTIIPSISLRSHPTIAVHSPVSFAWITFVAR